MFIHNLWEEDAIETVKLKLPVSIYSLIDPIKSPELLIFKEMQWSYRYQFWLTARGHTVLKPKIKVFIRVEEKTKFFAELAIALSTYIDSPETNIQPFDLPLPDELSSFMETGLGSFEEFYTSKLKEILSLQK